MTIELSESEFLAVLWAVQLTTATAVEAPQMFGQGTDHLIKTLVELNQRLAPRLQEAMAELIVKS